MYLIYGTQRYYEEVLTLDLLTYTYSGWDAATFEYLYEMDGYLVRMVVLNKAIDDDDIPSTITITR